MEVIKRDYDKNYPFSITDSWGDEVFCTIANLKYLKEQIEKILKEEEEKD